MPQVWSPCDITIDVIVPDSMACASEQLQRHNHRDLHFNITGSARYVSIDIHPTINDEFHGRALGKVSIKQPPHKQDVTPG